MAEQYFAHGDVIWYLPENEADIRKMLEREFGTVCKEHGGTSKDFVKTGEVWGWWSYRKGASVQPCFVHGKMDPLRKLPLLFTCEQLNAVEAENA